MPGTRYTIKPIPPIVENTKYIPAGALTFGVEYRVLNAEAIREAFKDDPAEMAKLGGAAYTTTVDDGGVSIHVFGAEDGREYLRFDCFRDEPHYHYINPTEIWQDRVDLDTIADGEILDWTLERLRSRLPEMLRHVGAERLAQQVDYAQIEAALPELLKTVAEFARIGAPAKVAASERARA